MEEKGACSEILVFSEATQLTPSEPVEEERASTSLEASPAWRDNSFKKDELLLEAHTVESPCSPSSTQGQALQADEGLLCDTSQWDTKRINKDLTAASSIYYYYYYYYYNYYYYYHYYDKYSEVLTWPLRCRDWSVKLSRRL